MGSSGSEFGMKVAVFRRGEAAPLPVRHCIARYGCPREVLTDNGSEFGRSL